MLALLALLFAENCPSHPECLGSILFFVDLRRARHRDLRWPYSDPPAILLRFRHLLWSGLTSPNLFCRIHRAPADTRAAIAGGIILATVIEAIVVCNLFACFNPPDCPDPDAPLDLFCLAVRIAAVIDKHG